MSLCLGGWLGGNRSTKPRNEGGHNQGSTEWDVRRATAPPELIVNSARTGTFPQQPADLKALFCSFSFGLIIFTCGSWFRRCRTNVALCNQTWKIWQFLGINSLPCAGNRWARKGWILKAGRLDLLDLCSPYEPIFQQIIGFNLQVPRVCLTSIWLVSRITILEPTIPRLYYYSGTDITAYERFKLIFLKFYINLESLLAREWYLGGFQ